MKTNKVESKKIKVTQTTKKDQINIEITQTPVRVKVDFGTVWAFVWRYGLIVIGLYLVIVVLVGLGGTL